MNSDCATLGQENRHYREQEPQGDRAHFQGSAQAFPEGQNGYPNRVGKGFDAFRQVEYGTITLQQVGHDSKVDHRIITNPPQ